MMRYQWPSPYSCAVVLSFDVDAEAPLQYRNSGQAISQMGESEERLFGVRVGLERILTMLADRRIRASFFVPGHTVRNHSSGVSTIHAAGHELAAHGDIHEPVSHLSPEQEHEIVHRQLAAFEDALEVRPIGFRGPAFDLNTGSPALLERHGFEYDSTLMGNDIPYLIDGTSLVEVPVHWMLDDAPLYRHVYGATNAIADPDRVLSMWRREFLGIREANGVMVLTMHPWIIGRTSRMSALGGLIDEMQSYGDVWFATTSEVGEWHRTIAPSGREE